MDKFERVGLDIAVDARDFVEYEVELITEDRRQIVKTGGITPLKDYMKSGLFKISIGDIITLADLPPSYY